MVLLTLGILSCLSAVSAPFPDTGLLAWFDAADAATLALESGRVSSWASKAAPPCAAEAPGEQRPVFVAGAGAQRPALRFDGLDDVLRVPAFNRRADTWTLIVVAAPFSPCRGGGLCSAAPVEGHDYDPGFTVDLYQSSQAFDQISIEGAGRISGQIDQMKSTYAYGGMHVITVVRTSQQVDLFIDGIPEGSRPVSPVETIMDVLRIGSRCYAGAERNFFHGDIAQVLVYGRALESVERESIESALRVSEVERAEGEKALLRRVEEQRRARMVPPRIVKSWPNIDAFLADGNGSLNPQTLPIRTDIREAITLSVQHLNSLYDRDKDNEPFFFVNREADGTGKMRHSVNIGIPHVVGRCLLGCMIAEQAAQVPFPQDGLAILDRCCKSSFDNPDHLNSYYDPERGGERFVEFHNMREGLYGLWALISGRQSEWAKETAHQMLVALDSITNEEGLWSIDLASDPAVRDRWMGLAPANAARMVDALLAYHECSGDPLALKLAGLYARQGLKTIFLEDCRFAPIDRSSGHVHSITSSLSGIAAYAVRTGDAEMLNACARIMDVGVPEYFSSWGWGDEVFPEHPADVISRGEINQTGDVVRTALILGAAGQPHYYEMAERYLRGMLLPTQHREEELRAILRDKPNPADDSERDTVRRSIGGYAMQLPNDRMAPGDWPISTLDITSGAVHAMSECYRQRTTRADGAYRMNLLFDYEDEAIAIASHLPQEGHIEFQAKANIPGLDIRIPEWVDAGTIEIESGGQQVPLNVTGSFAHIGALSAGQEGHLSFAVPCKREKETVDGVEYTTTWIGSQLIDIAPRGTQSPLPF
ncbi:MAG: hypothetical protein IT364_03290 [Candidatus Hydrogenedentes bacterium]|nr:hypothetical protein [Candidatus Hydrogenedentota bacterium]